MSRRQLRHCIAALLVATLAGTTAIALAQEHGGGAPAGHAPAGEHGAAAGEHGATAPAGEHGAPGEAEEHGEHAAGAHGGHHGPEAINWLDVTDKKKPAYAALVINFGVLMAFYYIMAKKPVAEALKQRRITIGKDIDEAQKLLDEAKERAKKYQGDLKNAEVDAATAKAGLISSGKGEVDHLLVDAQERADRMKRDADRLVEQERKQVHQDLLHETVNLAVKEAATMLEKSVSADDHARLAQDLLLELSSRPSAPRAAPAGPAGGPVRPAPSGGTV